MKKVVFVALVGVLCPLLPARAVVLEQKWKVGQQLSYETALRGTMNVQAPANARFVFAGVPLEVEIRGDGLANLQTLAVDEKGVGTVTMRVPQFDLRAEALGQKGQMLLQNGTSRVTLNGQPIKFGDGANPLANPKTALRISPQGRFLGVQNLQPKTVEAPKARPKNEKPVDAAQAINKSALLMASIIRALPTLWPGRDVQSGEKWKAEISWPVPSPTDPKKMVPTQFGAWDLTLKGAETVGGKTLQRVGVVGTLAVDSAQFQPVDATKPRGKGKQDVKGDVWLDAEAGQIVRADLIVDARAEGGKDAASQAWMDFTGTLQLNLKGAN